MRGIKSLVAGVAVALILAGCAAKGDYQGLEYAPNMYHSVPYDPLREITDENAGRWVTSIDYPDGHAEYFNTNKYNPNRMNMRMPPANTVKRTPNGWLPYRIPKDSLALASKMKSPLDSTAEVIADGKILYQKYCAHCHGPQGTGDGKVAAGVTVDGVQKSAYNGVPNYNSDALKNITEGHIFHVITHGKGLMWAHGSQVSPEDRWKIAKYVKTLQK